MKTRFFLLCSLILSAACLTACAAPSTSAPAAQAGTSAAAEEPIALSDNSGSNHRQQLEEYGRLERLRMEIPVDAPAAVQARNFSISAQELDALAGEYILFNHYSTEEAHQKALDLLIETHAVYAYALSRGCSADESTLDALIADEQNSDTINPADFKVFLQGFDGEEAFYWSLRREDLRMDQTIDLFKETCRAGYDNADVPFETYYTGLIADIIDSEEIQILSD